MLEVSHLTCEYQKNPLGIGETKPRFAWWIESDRDETMQTAYQVHVAKSRSFDDIIWDSDFIASNMSHQVVYEGPCLLSKTRYYWRVRVTDNYNRQSKWSDPAWFETTMLNVKDEWKAAFISPESQADASSSAARRLRKNFELPGECRSARVYVTALGLYRISINGHEITEDLLRPGWTEYHKRLQFQTYDVTRWLKSGQNVIGATLGCGWYKGDLAGWLGRRAVYGKQTALSLQLELRFKDGSEQTVLTDASWRSSDGPIRFSELYHGEIYDARLEDPGWDKPEYDDQHWHEVIEWPVDRSVLVPQYGPSVRRQSVLKPVAVFTTPKGETVLDFGQNLAGFVRFEVSGLSGERVVLRHAEVLDADGNFYTENMRSARNQIEYILRGGDVEIFEPHFTFQGFRYVQVVAYPGPIIKDSFSAVVIHSDFEQTGQFHCSERLLNQLHQNILWGLKGNFIDIPTDCPQRDERLGWTGDAQVFISTAVRMVNAAPFMTKWLRDLSAAQLPDGGIPYVVPDILTKPKSDSKPGWTSYAAAGWGDAAVICPWVLFQAYRDRDLLQDLYPTMKKWVSYIQRQATKGLIWDTGQHFGDWLALDAKPGSYRGATPNDLTATAFYAHSADWLAQAAAVLGYEREAKTYQLLHEQIVDAFQDEFITPAGRLTAQTQTAHVLTLHFNLAPQEHRARMVRSLLDLIDEAGGHLTTGFLGTPYLCQVLSDNDCLDQAYALLLRKDYPSWLYPITKGATTMWEHWDGIKPDGSFWSADMNSFNHYAYGCIGDWLYRVVAGLDTDPDHPGYSQILFQPQPGGGIKMAEAEHICPYGPVKISWVIEKGRMTMSIHVPHNTTARLVLPKADPKRFAHHPNIDRKRETFDRETEPVIMKVGSGTWTFQYAWPENETVTC